MNKGLFMKGLLMQVVPLGIIITFAIALTNWTALAESLYTHKFLLFVGFGVIYESISFGLMFWGILEE